MWATIGNILGVRPPTPLEFTSCHKLTQVLVIELQDLTFALLDFSLALVWFLSIPLILLKWKYLPCASVQMSAVFNFLLHFYRCSQLTSRLRFAASLRTDFGLGLFSNAGTIKTSEILIQTRYIWPKEIHMSLLGVRG